VPHIIHPYRTALKLHLRAPITESPARVSACSMFTTEGGTQTCPLLVAHALPRPASQQKRTFSHGAMSGVLEMGVWRSEFGRPRHHLVSCPLRSFAIFCLAPTSHALLCDLCVSVVQFGAVTFIERDSPQRRRAHREGIDWPGRKRNRSSSQPELVQTLMK